MSYATRASSWRPCKVEKCFKSLVMKLCVGLTMLSVTCRPYTRSNPPSIPCPIRPLVVLVVVVVVVIPRLDSSCSMPVACRMHDQEYQTPGCRAVVRTRSNRQTSSKHEHRRCQPLRQPRDRRSDACVRSTSKLSPEDVAERTGNIRAKALGCAIDLCVPSLEVLNILVCHATS
jgi:hypothetical protein